MGRGEGEQAPGRVEEGRGGWRREGVDLLRDNKQL